MNRHMVQFHLFRIFEKLGVSSRIELVLSVVSPGDADKAGVAVKEPEGPKLGSGSVAANLDKS